MTLPVGDELADTLEQAILTPLTGELGAELEVTSFMAVVPFNFVVPATVPIGTISFLITLVLKLVVTVPEVLIEDEGVIMTKVGPLFLVLLANEGCVEDVLTEVDEDAAVVVVVPDDDDDGDGAGSGVGLGEDLNLLSRIESNSANCSMVLEDIDLTTGCCCCCFMLV